MKDSTKKILGIGDVDFDDVPTVGDFADKGEILDALRDSLQRTFSTRLLILWREQNPDQPDPDPENPISIIFTPEVTASVVDELARNSSQPVLFVGATKLPEGMR